MGDQAVPLQVRDWDVCLMTSVFQAMNMLVVGMPACGSRRGTGDERRVDVAPADYDRGGSSLSWT